MDVDRHHLDSRTRPAGIGVGLCTALLLAFAPGPLLAADWYVDAANPNCPGSGSPADPFCTIAAAVAAAASGDTVHVAPGSYAPGAVNVTKSLAIVGGPGVVVNGAFTVAAPLVAPDQTVVFESLEIQGNVTNYDSKVTLSNSTVTSSGPFAVMNVASACCDLLGYSHTQMTITDCAISATGLDGIAVMNISSASSSWTGVTAQATATISNSSLSGTIGAYNSAYVGLGSSFGFQIGTSKALFTIANSTVAGTGTGIRNDAATFTYGFPGDYQNTAAVTVTNSTVAGASVGVSNNAPFTPYSSAAGTTTSMKLVNTVVAGNTQDLSGTVTSLGHNCIGNTAGGTLAGSGTGDLLNVDPKFVDAPGGDHRLLPTSPCIDAGDNAAAAAIAVDLDGLPRFVDDPATPDTGSGTAPIVDMGAYEYQCGLAYGAGCPGAGGFVPALTKGSCAVAGQPLSLTVAQGAGGSTAFLFIGLTPAALPIGLTGCTLGVAPLFPQTVPLPLGGFGPGAGTTTIAAVVPAVAAGVTVTLQAFVVDASQPHGFSNSNGLLIPIS